MGVDDHPLIKTIELVVQKNNSGAFVVIYYHDGKVVTYPNPHLTVDRKYLKPNIDWSIANEQPFEYVFKETKTGVLLALDITIENQLRVKIDIRENSSVPAEYSFLAAIGADLKEVKRFPFIFLKKAGFVQVKNTDTSLEIGSKTCGLTRVPLKVEGKKCYRTVYSFSPLPFFWNEAVVNASLPVMSAGNDILRLKNAAYFFDKKNGYNEIKKMSYTENGNTQNFRFSPAFPDLAALKNGAEICGRFCIGVDDMEGIVCGKYGVARTGEEINIDFKPERCWQPMPGKDWVGSYQYSAKIKLLSRGHFTISSKWQVD